MVFQQYPPAAGPVIVRAGIVLVVTALALVGCGDTEEPTSPAVAPSAAPEPADEPVEEEVADESVEESEEEAEAGTREAPLPLGERVQLGDYEVAVAAVNLDATDVVMDANEFNEPPAEGSTFVLVTLAGTFLGEENSEGMPGWELRATIVGNDAKQYTDSDSFAVPPNPLIESPTLEAGGEFEGNFVIELPTDALEGAALFVEPVLSFDDERAYWALG